MNAAGGGGARSNSSARTPMCSLTICEPDASRRCRPMTSISSIPRDSTLFQDRVSAHVERRPEDELNDGVVGLHALFDAIRLQILVVALTRGDTQRHARVRVAVVNRVHVNL